MATKLMKACVLGALMSSSLLGANVATANDTLTTTSWRLTGIQAGRAMPTASFSSGVQVYRYQMVFSGGNMSIRGGCNNLSGTYRVGADGKLQLGPLMGTKRACERPLMAADNELANLVGRMSVLNQSGLQLTMTNGMQSLVFKGTPFVKKAEGTQVTTKFIEFHTTARSIPWREAKYNANAIQTNRNEPYQYQGFKGIQGFNPEPNMRYIVRVKEVRDGRTNQVRWMMDQVIESEDVRIQPR